jgi:hypothetical protein
MLEGGKKRDWEKMLGSACLIRHRERLIWRRMA